MNATRGYEARQAMSEGSFRERKRSLSGAERTFDCEPIAVTPRLAVVRFVFTAPLTAGGNTFAAGGYTEGFFWRDRNYNLYHIVSREGASIADRFDVVDRVRIRPDGVRYDDLLLDVWLYAGGRVVVEDEDEVEEAIRTGRLSPHRIAIIARTRSLLVRRGRGIAERALQELAALRQEAGLQRIVPESSSADNSSSSRSG